MWGSGDPSAAFPLGILLLLLAVLDGLAQGKEDYGRNEDGASGAAAGTAWTTSQEVVKRILPDDVRE
ncbi:hypothetical protein E2C01_014475 [Portunus trituberculatus]|uniref:Uncharacterized protein n=1 Tax=Portunus trituberculatus TaxID=210409 RepID=A0A5B7DK69_PORTR|nr:hypothetical protein [Portunus trituberculatus]